MVALGRWLLRHVLRLAYDVRVTGLEHYAQAGQRVLIVANHTSFLDAALLGRIPAGSAHVRDQHGDLEALVDEAAAEDRRRVPARSRRIRTR